MLRYSTFSDDVYESSQLEKVILDKYQNITYISEKISNLINLVELHFTYNPILNLPNEINKLSKLEILNLSHNLFTSFPENLNLKTLKILNLSNNNISIIGSNIGLLNNLETLVLSNNKLNELHIEFKNLSNLKDLFLHSNNFSIFPNEICFLTNLEILYLSNNNIDNISSNIQNLYKLEEFYINNNKLTYITNNIILCRNLLVFIYKHNYITYNSPQITRFLNKMDKRSVYKFLYNIINNEYDIDLINKVMTITNKQIKINKKELIDEIIKDNILKTDCKLLLIKYSNSYEYHNVLLIRFIELLYYIWINITKKDKFRINKQLKENLPLELQFKALL